MGAEYLLLTVPQFFKAVAEKGDWEDPTIREAEAAFYEGDMEGAFLRYLFSAERGIELAQTNAAWLIDRGLFCSLIGK